MIGQLGRLASAMAIFGFMSVIAATGVNAEEFSFKAYNSTSSKIKKILVSEDGRTWGNFEIGSGIRPGETVELVWDESTNNEDCNQLVKAVFADGSESEPAEFNFCEKGLDLEF